MITLVWRTDVHLADTSPQSRTDNWSETLLGKLREVGEIARAVDAHAVLDGGDFFHVKAPMRNSHRIVHKVAELHADYPCPVYANVGNHDCKYGDLDYLPDQPLGVLLQSGVFKRCYDEHEVTFRSWPTTGMCENITVRVVGVPYHGTVYDMERLTSIKKGAEDYLVVMAHMLASPTGGMMFEGEDIVKYEDLADLDPDVFCFGHWHKNQGITTLPNGKQIVNIGSLSRGSLHQDDLDRRPAVAILTFDRDGVVIAQQELDTRPPSEVFDLEKKVRAEIRDFSIETFVDSIQETLSESQLEDIPDIIREMPGIPEPVREQAILFWENSL